ncbi:hypothetical protein D9M70_434610 [compost metagenome]
MDHLAEADFLFVAAGLADHHAVTVELLVQAQQLLFQALVAVFQLGALGGDIGLGLGGQGIVQFQLAGIQAQALEAVVDAADVLLLQLVELGVEVVDPLQALLQLGHGGLAFGHHLAVLLHGHQAAVEVAPLAALQHQQFGRRLLVLQPVAHHPGEVAAVDVAVAHLEQLAGHELRAVFRHRKASALQARTGHFLDLHRLGDHLLGSLAGHRVGRLHQVGRPEVAEAAYGNYREQADGHDDGDGYRAAAHPDARCAALEPVFQGNLFHGFLHRLSLSVPPAAWPEDSCSMLPLPRGRGSSRPYSEAYFLRRR